MKRSVFIRQTSLVTTGLLLGKYISAASPGDYPVVRIPEGKRKFNSAAVEKRIAIIKNNIRNKEIAWLFENCFPNTLDTTVDFGIIDGKPDTFVITGDIDAMWLRDSSAQVWPYLSLMKEDQPLQELVKGVINRQVKCILKDPYANAFYKDEKKTSEWKDDQTPMKPGVHERKWEIDSLCYPIRLCFGYWKETGDTSVFDEEWKRAMQAVIRTFKEQQRFENNGPYTFQRLATNPIDSVPMGGYGFPTKKNGLIHSMFRPSDDATVYPYLVPSNIFALQSLDHLIVLSRAFKDDRSLITAAEEVRKPLSAALEKIVIDHPVHGKVYPYEVDGFGNYSMMDDANIPSLLGLPYLNGSISNKDAVYLNTRKFVLGDANPFFFKGVLAEGMGGPHIGMDYIWPMSIIMRGLTSNDGQEIKACIDMLQKTHAGKGFMHEAFHKDDPSKFTRSWFAWANTLFGEFIWKTYTERPGLL